VILRRVRVATLAAAVSTLLAATACGEATYGSSHETREQARAAVETWLGACAVANGEAVIDTLPRPTRELVFTAPEVTVGCERIADLTPAPSPSPEELRTLFGGAKVEHVEVDGGYGKAVVRSAHGNTSELELEVDRGRWLLSKPPLGS
jgi:hypothetical protein